MKILVSGASGLLGRTLLRDLQIAGHDVYALVRNPEKISELDPSKVFKWQANVASQSDIIAQKDVVIHLAGEGIADQPWTKERKKQLQDSRILTTSHLVEATKLTPPEQRPRLFISASAIGIYGDGGDTLLDESSPNGTDFLADLCSAWEKPTKSLLSYDVRVVTMRLGLILSKEGGFLSKMAPVILGNGKQWTSWVHISDVTKFVKTCLEDNRFQGPFNLVSPNPLTNSELTKIYAKKMGYPLTIKAPEFALKLALGEMSSALLTSQKVAPKNLLSLNYSFEFSDFSKALDDIYQNDGFLDNFHIVNQFVPLSREKIFPFFSRAENLEVITPPWLNFKITKKSTEFVEKNILIDYKLKIHGIPIKWRTQISEWKPDQFFVDDQLKGPYTKWHHRHLFDVVPGGTLLRDEVTFRVPGSILGKIFLLPWIRKDVQTIFSFRKSKIIELQKQGKFD